MPRRPRHPSSQQSAKEPKSQTYTGKHPLASTQLEVVKNIPTKAKAPSLEYDDSDSDSLEETGSNLDNGSDVADDQGVPEEDEDDVDRPRVAQWIDEEDLEAAQESSSDEDMTHESFNAPSKLKHLQNDVSGLPLGALRKAQRVLDEAEVDNDSGDDSALDRSSEEKETQAPKGKSKEKPEWSIKPRSDIAKRSNKHAPTEVTSKRPVTRKRTVVEVKTLVPRDPRFLPVAGEFSAPKFQQAYGFLHDSHKTELKTLRETLQKAKKLLASSPRDLREEREREVERLELAVKRAESLVNRDRREKIEQEAVSKMDKEEREKRKQGKGGWWMKDSDKKDMLTRARYDALAAGGKRAVQKAIERKQKKLGQKEKRSRPFPKSGDRRPLERGADAGRGDDGERPNKRRRVG